MAALAMAVFSTVASTVSSVAGAATTAVGAAGSALGGGSFLTSLLQGGMGVLGAMGAMREGDASARTAMEQSAEATANSQQETLAGMQRQGNLRRQLLADQGMRDVQAAASGIDLSFGTPALARDQANDDAARALAIEGSSAAARSAQFSAKAAGYQRLASENRKSGWLKALGIAGSTGLSIVKRG